MARLDVDYLEVVQHTKKLRSLITGIAGLAPHHQKLVCELALMRQFGVLEERLGSVVLKILSGTTYCDGRTPALLHKSLNSANAESNVKSFGRNKPLRKVKWTVANDVRGQVKYLLDSSDPFYTTLTAHETHFDEMRRIRHHIAHYNSDTRRKYRPVVEKYYGVYVPSVTPGVLLLSARQTPPLIQQYLTASLVMMREITRS